MAWTEPKINWSAAKDSNGKYVGDYFNATDYQRIKSNLTYLRELAGSMYPAIVLPAIPDRAVGDGLYTADINALERSLDALVAGTFDPGIPARKTWASGVPCPLAEDIERIERSCLQLYNTWIGQQVCLPRLVLILGGVQIG